MAAAASCRLLVDQDEGRPRDRPGARARLVGQDDAEARRAGPSRRSPRRLERLRGRGDGLAVLVDHLGVGQLVLLGIGIFDVADRALGLADVVGDAFVALGADADRPLDRGVGADLGLPVRADLRRGSRSKMKVVPDPSERCTTTIGCAGSLADGLSLAIAGSFQVLISPRKILASVGPSRVTIARLDAVEVDDRHDAAHHGRELHQARLLELLRLQRHVGGAEGHGLGLDLLDAAARADRLVVQPDAGLFLVGVGPFRIDRIGERRAGAGDVDGERRARSPRRRSRRLRSVCGKVSRLSPVGRDENGSRRRALHPRLGSLSFLVTVDGV